MINILYHLVMGFIGYWVIGFAVSLSYLKLSQLNSEPLLLDYDKTVVEGAFLWPIVFIGVGGELLLLLFEKFSNLYYKLEMVYAKKS